MPKVLRKKKGGAKKPARKRASFSQKHEKKSVKRVVTATQTPSPTTKAQEKEAVEEKIKLLMKRGKERGFVTYAEILYYFPTIEDNIMLLEDLYTRLEANNVDILESDQEALSAASVPHSAWQWRQPGEGWLELIFSARLHHLFQCAWQDLSRHRR